MFGGIAFLVAGHMACGVVGDDLLLRVGEHAHADALRRAHARVMDFTGRPSRGMIYVAPPGIATRAKLQAWIARALAHVATLPPRTNVSTRGTRSRARAKGRAPRSSSRTE